MLGLEKTENKIFWHHGIDSRDHVIMKLKNYEKLVFYLYLFYSIFDPCWLVSLVGIVLYIPFFFCSKGCILVFCFISVHDKESNISGGKRRFHYLNVFLSWITKLL